MESSTLVRLDRWTRGTGLVALAALAWAIFVPGGALWSAILAAGLIGTAVATALLVWSRSTPTLAQVITRAEVGPARAIRRGYRSVIGPRSGEGPTP